MSKTYTPGADVDAIVARQAGKGYAATPDEAGRASADELLADIQPTLGALLACYARARLFSEEIVDRPWKDRALGKDIE